MYVNNLGGGFANFIEIEANTTVEQFFQSRFHDTDADDYLIRVNRQPVPRSYVLQENDRITITPVKIEGAQVA